MSNLLIVDLESTCWDPADRKQTLELMEVIEFGCVVCTSEGEIVASFSQLVRPLENPLLTDFCIKLTGISQEMVDSAPRYEEAVNLVSARLKSYEIECWLSWGEYDRNHLISHQARSGVSPSFLVSTYINLKDVYRRFKGSRRKADAHRALAKCGMVWEGSQHRAESDALNYARLVGPMSEIVKDIYKEKNSYSK